MYLLAINVLGLYSILSTLAALSAAFRAEGLCSTVPKIPGMILMGAGAMLPFGLEILGVGGPQLGGAAVWISTIAALIIAGLVSRLLVNAYRHSESIAFQAVGANLLVLASCVVVTIAGYKHITFDAKDGGMANIGLMRELGIAGDVKCNANVVIVRWQSTSMNEPVYYRCPTGLVLNQRSHLPFVPWPGYEEGESLDLAKEFREMRKQIPTDAE